MADTVAPASKGIAGHVRGWIKGVVGLFVGVGSGVFMMYSNAIVDQIVKPDKALANFAVSVDGLTVTCQNHATGQSGWWDFNDGTPLEPFDAKQPSIAHTYATPGKYSVKLSVRNFLNEENDRTVAVDCSQPPQTLPPTITALKVDPLGAGNIAPAGFRVTGEAKNATQLVFDAGKEKLEIIDVSSGPFERFVVFPEAGAKTIRVMGITGKQVVKQEVNVNVSAPQAGSVSMLVNITDSGMMLDKRPVNPTVVIPLPKKGEKTFEKTLSAEPGYTISEAKIVKPNAAVAKNMKIEISPDKKSGKLTGEWAAAGDALTKAAGGSDAQISLEVKQERRVPIVQPTQPFSALLSAPTFAATINLPPQRLDLADAKRKYEVQIIRANPDCTQDVLVNEADAKFPLQKTAQRPGIGYGFGADVKGNILQVRMNTAK
jgi:PKD repeat protein